MSGINIESIVLALMYIGAIGLFLTVVGFLFKNVIPDLFRGLDLKGLIYLGIASVASLVILSWGPYLAFTALLEGWMRAAPKMAEASQIVIEDIQQIVEGTMPDYQDTSANVSESPFVFPDEPEPTETPFYTPVPAIPTPVITPTVEEFNFDTWSPGDPVPPPNNGE